MKQHEAPQAWMLIVLLEAFSFTQYGAIDALVAALPSDAIHEEALGLVCKTKVVMNTSSAQVDARLENLVLGMLVTIEVKAGKKGLIEYFPSPLKQIKQEYVMGR
jgi:hemolysin D